MNISKKKAIRILDEIYQIASGSTLTGELKGGSAASVSMYNKIREFSIKKGWVDEDLAEILDADTSMAVVGVSATLLSAMLEEEEIEESGENKKYDENGYEIIIKSE